MKMVLTASEVATALGHTEESFMKLKPKLESLGFPKPVRGLEDRWSIIEVSNWVNNSDEETENRIYAA